jgi:hypothetical protein
MSVRENIAANIKTVLTAMSSPVAASYVTREPFDFTQLSNAQFPAILVQTAGESRSDETIGDSNIQRMGVITYDIVGYVKSSTIDTARNQLIEAIEEALDADRTRGGYAKDTQVVNVETDEGATDPVGGIIVTVEVEYFYTRGAA